MDLSPDAAGNAEVPQAQNSKRVFGTFFAPAIALVWLAQVQIGYVQV